MQDTWRDGDDKYGLPQETRESRERSDEANVGSRMGLFKPLRLLTSVKLSVDSRAGRMSLLYIGSTPVV